MSPRGDKQAQPGDSAGFYLQALRLGGDCPHGGVQALALGGPTPQKPHKSKDVQINTTEEKHRLVNLCPCSWTGSPKETGR